MYVREVDKARVVMVNGLTNCMTVMLAVCVSSWIVAWLAWLDASWLLG